MKKYFICSDIHSFYTEFKHALKKAKFDSKNPDHILIVCGDIFDRGVESKKVYNFLKSLPKERRILIRGNHEYLLEECLNRKFPDSCDFTNGTVNTICQLCDADITYLKYPELALYENMNPYTYWEDIKKISEYFVKPVIDWIKSDEWCDYFETDNYIMTHAFIPLGIDIKKYPQAEKFLYYGNTYGMPTEYFQYREDWRNATDVEFADATWVCPWKLAKQGLNKTGKTIICGHWHTSDFFNNLTNQKKELKDCPIFNSKKYKIIGLDACTALSKKINVLILNENEL